MKLKTTYALRFIEVKELYSKKNDSRFKVISFGDPIKFQPHEYFMNDNLEIPNDLVEGEEVYLTLEAQKRGYNTTYNLVKVEREY